MTCGHNGREDDDSCSGLAVICVGAKRLEGKKLAYRVGSDAPDELHYTAADDERSVRWDGRWTFEIGGRKKSFSQIADLPDSYVVSDGVSVGRGNRIPLWLFGFLY